MERNNWEMYLNTIKAAYLHNVYKKPHNKETCKQEFKKMEYAEVD
jgi:hypothetical protein